MTAMDYAIASIETMMRKFKAEELPPARRLHYHQGVFLTGVKDIYQIMDDEKKAAVYKKYVEDYIDSCIDENGDLIQCDLGQFDDMEPGILMFSMYEERKDEKYKKILDSFMESIRNFPKIKEGGFFHKVFRYHQMWLDSLYMAGPLCCEYGARFNEPWLFDETYTQITLMRKKTRDAKTGLWYHAYDDSRECEWADKETGLSPEFWGRSIGWVPMAILDDLEFIPEDYDKRQEIIDIAVDLIKSICKFQSASGMWYQVVDKVGCEGNWPETSCTCLYVAAICKAVKMGFLDESYLEYAKKGYRAVIASLQWEGEDVLIGGVCVGTGVGDYTHYINRPTSTNDLHGVGAFLIMCALVQSVIHE